MYQALHAGVPSAGIALILGVDRILDMCCTVANVTVDLTVDTIVVATENQLHTPAADATGGVCAAVSQVVTAAGEIR